MPAVSRSTSGQSVACCADKEAVGLVGVNPAVSAAKTVSTLDIDTLDMVILWRL